MYGFIRAAANTLTLKSDLRARRRRKNLEFTVARQAESSVFTGTFRARLIRRLRLVGPGGPSDTPNAV